MAGYHGRTWRGEVNAAEILEIGTDYVVVRPRTCKGIARSLMI